MTGHAMIGEERWEQGIAIARPGRWHGRVERTHAVEKFGRRRLQVQEETCPHEHRTRQAADKCGSAALARIVANGGWLDEENDRRRSRLVAFRTS